MIVTVLAKETSHMAMEMKHKYFKNYTLQYNIALSNDKNFGRAAQSILTAFEGFSS